jgi:predicted nuclease of predicted toxin-antitoxin system
MLFIFDNNCPPALAKGLNLIEEGNDRSPIKVKVSHVRDFLNENATDEEIIKCAGENKGIIITYDKDFKHIKHYYALYRDFKVGVVFYKSGKHMNYWEMVKTFINRWEEMKSNVKDSNLPFAFEVNSKGVNKLSF